MGGIARFSIALILSALLPQNISRAAGQIAFDPYYVSKLIGEPAELQIGADKLHLMRTFELAAIDGTSLAGAVTALCHQNKVEDKTSAPSTFSCEAYCTWRDDAGDLIFESYNGGAGPDDNGDVTFGSGLLVGGTGKYRGKTGGFGWANDGKKGHKRGLYYLPGQ